MTGRVSRAAEFSRPIRPTHLPMRESPEEEPPDLNHTLFKRDHMLGYIKQGTHLEARGRRLSMSSQPSRARMHESPVFAEIMQFLQSLSWEFKAVNLLIDNFLKRIQQLEPTLAKIVTVVPTDKDNDVMKIQQAFFSNAGGSSGQLKSPILESTKKALKQTQQASMQCASAAEQMVKVLEPDPEPVSRYSDADVVKTIQTCRDFEQEYRRDVSSLQGLCADAAGVIEQVKESIKGNRWLEIELVRNTMGDARRKVRELQNLQESCITLSSESERSIQRLVQQIEQLERAPVSKRTEALDTVQQTMTNLQINRRQSIRGQWDDTKRLQYEMVEKANKLVTNLDPTADWKILQRVPQKHRPLCCLIRGPIDIVSHLKIINRKKNHLRNTGLIAAQETLMSDVIELNNLSSITGVKWPLILCLPQKKLIERSEECNVYLKYSRDTHSRHWNKEAVLTINKHFSRKPNLAFLRGTYFTEAKITCFATYAVITECTTNQNSLLPDCDPFNPRLSSAKPPAVVAMMEARRNQRDAVLSDPFLYELASSFHEMWKRIVINLGVPIDQVKTYQMNHPHAPTEDVILDCLTYWKKLNSTSTRKVEDLKTVLRACERPDLVTRIEEREQIVMNGGGGS